MPNTTETVTCLDNFHVQAFLSQLMKKVDAGEPSANDDGV
jgi:hypothetical protein